jgi:hypothetical protein
MLKVAHSIIQRRENRDPVAVSQQRFNHGSPKIPYVPGGVRRHYYVQGIAFLERVQMSQSASLQTPLNSSKLIEITNGSFI